MINKILLFLFSITFTLLFTAGQLKAVPMSGNYNVGTGQTYTSLTKPSGFFADVNTRGLSGNVTVFITSDLNEDATNAVNQWTETGVGGYTITIVPSAASLRTISVNANKPLISLNGADRITFDGRFGGSGKYLLFRNTSGSNPAFNFQNDAQNNTITYCIIESNNAGALGSTGTIVFGTTAGAGVTGNNNNTISFCDIRDRSDAAGTPITAIYASGNTAAPNSNNTIDHCNIFNTYNAASTFVDMYILDGTANWVITNNSFYQTSARAPGGGSAYFGLIIATSGNNNLISGNYFGGSAANCGGTAMTFAGGGLFGFRIWQVGTTTATTVSNNTIANIDNTLNVAGDYFFFRGIEVNISGSVNVTNNTVGATSGTNSIILRYASASGNPYPAAIAFAYDWLGVSAVTGSVTNNNIGSISLTGAGTTAGIMTYTGIIDGFGVGYSNVSATISGNSVGNATVSNFQNTLNVNTTFMGIASNVTSPGVVSVTNNTVSNLTDGTLNSTASLRGIFLDGSATYTATGNTVTSLNTTSTNVAGLTGNNPNNAVNGISTGTSATGVNTISNNTISAIRSLTAGATNTSSKGIVITGNGTGTINANKIYDLTNVSTGAGPAIFGLFFATGNMTVSNNMVTITNGELSDNYTNNLFPPIPGVNPPVPYEDKHIQHNTNNLNSLTGNSAPMVNKTGTPVEDRAPKNGEFDSFNGMLIQGIHDETSVEWKYYYNTVYIGGSVNTGANLTSCYTRDINAANKTLKNNLFFNARTGNGTHVAINNNIAGGNINGNYNVLVSSNAASIGMWLGASETMAAWRTSSANDKQSWSTVSGSLLATNLFTSISTGDLHINSANTEAWLVSGKGIAVATAGTDFDGNSRSAAITTGTTDIGADEFAGTPPSNPNATVDFAPGSGVTSTYTLWGRTIAVINWGAGGSSYPASVNIQYYSGVNPPSVVGGNYSNSYWVVTPTGTLTGATYDITYTFGDNETYTISTPSTNTRLAKYNPSSWEVFITAGTGVYQTDLVWANLTIKSRGMFNFSTYALTDVNGPLPVSLMYFSAAAVSRDVKLSWATAWETNNKGFDIERRNIISENNYSNWQSVGFLNGAGTTTQQTNYSFSDSKLVTGSYQYRLKQIDYNGNAEYFNLNSPSSVVIGSPVAFDVFQNYPNPSNPSTKIDYQLPFAGKVSLKIYDISGREVATLVDRTLDAGYYTNEFNGVNTSSGVYFYRLIATSNDGQKFSKTMKMIVVK